MKCRSEFACGNPRACISEQYKTLHLLTGILTWPTHSLAVFTSVKFFSIFQTQQILRPALRLSICYKYGIKWRYEFNHSKSRIVIFGESKSQHFKYMKNRVWLLGDTIVDELYEYKNLGALKNYMGSFSSNVEDNIDKTRKKVGLIFASDFDRRKVNPLVYMKL